MNSYLQPEARTHKFARWAALFILIIIVPIGFYLRIWHLGEQSLWIDEGYSINAADAILENGYPKLDSGKIYSNSPLNTYITAGAVKVLGFDPVNPWTARLPSVIFGVGIILITYFLSMAILENKALALLSATIITLSFWEIEWSRQVRGYIELQFFLLTALLYLWRWLQSRDRKNILLFLLFGVAAFLSHPLGIILIPVPFVALAADNILHRKKHTKRSDKLLFFIITGLLIIWGAVFILPGLKIYNFTQIYRNFLFENLRAFTWASLAGVGLGVLDKKKFWPVTFLSISLLFPLLLVVGYTPLVQMRYLFPIFPLMVILSVYAVWRVTEFIFTDRLSWLKIPATTLIAFLLFQSALVFVPQGSYHLEPDSPRPNFEEAYSLIQRERIDDDIVISPYAHLNKIYLEDKGYWLPISLTGKKSDLERTIIDGKYDYYVGAPIIENSDHLAELLDERHGFIIIDGMARIRLNEQVPEIINHPKTTEIYASGEKRLNKIWLYQF